MNDLDPKKLQNQPINSNPVANPCTTFKNILVTVQMRKNKVRKRRAPKKQNFTQPTVIYHLSNFGSKKSRRHVTKQASMPEIRSGNITKKPTRQKPKSLTAIPFKNGLPCSKYLLREHCFRYKLNPLTNNKQPIFKIYRCQLTSNVAENCDNCCCSCNSDTMFEVMKDLYDCYKKRNCDNCNCILCCHMPKGKSRPSKPCPEINLECALKELAMRGFALPEGKTESEKKIISDLRKNVGLPPEPTSQLMREKYTSAANAGLMFPLEGKSPKEKEKILRGLHDSGIPLPVGRTPSEQKLIDKVEGKTKKVSEVECQCFPTLEGKSPDQREKILKDQAMRGVLLPKAKTPSQEKIINKIRADLGLPPSPKTSSLRNKYEDAAQDGILVPLEGKSDKEKERILRGLQERGIPLPEGRTPSEKALIDKVLSEKRASSIKMRKSKAELQEKKLRELSMKGLPLPEAKTESEKYLLKKVRADLGLPPEPKTQGMKNRYNKAENMGLMVPLEGKSLKEKEKILRGLNALEIPLPKGRTPSEEALIAKIKGEPRDSSMLGGVKVKEAKSSKLVMSLEGKTPEEMEKILKKLAMRGIPLPEGNTASQKKLIKKVRTDLGLPPEPKTQALKDKHRQAAQEGLLLPLEGKSPEEKEVILQGLLKMGIPLPTGRTPSEKALIAKVKERHALDKKTSSSIKEGEGPIDECLCNVLAPPMLITMDLKRRAKAAEQALDGKTPEEKNKILISLANDGIPLPKGKTSSEKKMILQIRKDLGLPPEPKTDSMRIKYNKAAEKNLLKPLEGQSPEEKERILQGLIDLEIPLPKPRTASEKSLIVRLQLKSKRPSEKMRRAKAAGLLTPLDGKTPSQQEQIVRDLARIGIELPKGRTDSQTKLIIKVRNDLGLPPEPKNSAMRLKHAKAAELGFLQPLEGKTPEEKEKILRRLHDIGITLPKPRSPSEQSLIIKIQGRKVQLSASQKMRGAKAAGLLTPLKGKTSSQIEIVIKGLAEQGLPLPEGETKSERDIINKVRIDIGLPPAPKTPSMRKKYIEATNAGIIQPLEGKTRSEKEKIIRGMVDAGLPLPKPRSASEKALIDNIRGEARLPKRKPSEKIRKKHPEIKTSKIPDHTSITTKKLKQAKEAGLLTPLVKKSPEEKEKILRNLAKMGLPLPEGKTRSEKALINKVRKDYNLPIESSSEKIRKADTAGFLTPLDGKTEEQKEKILRGIAAAGLPLPTGKTPSEKDLIRKVKASTGYVTPSPSKTLQQAEAAGLLPYKGGKTPAEKERALRKLAAAGISLPEGKTPSEREMINKIKAQQKTKSGQLKAAKAAGLLTPLKGKTPEQREKILRGLVKNGIPLPEGKTPSEKSVIDKVRASMGLPPSPKTPSMKEKYKKAEDAGIITPLEGKSKSDKEKILKRLHDAGIPLPVGRTPSEKSLIKRIKAGLSEPRTPFEEMTPARKEKILKGLIKSGKSLPEAKTPSGKDLISKVRRDMGLPPELESTSMKEKMRKAHSAGLITPLEGKTPDQKEKILRGLAEAGIPLPEGRTSSEKALKRKIEDEAKKKLHRTPPTRKSARREGSETGLKLPPKKLKKAEELGLMTPLTGKSKKDKEKILRGLAKLGLPLPDGATPSESQLIKQVRKDMGLPPHPETLSMKKRHLKAADAGALVPLEGLTPAEKEEVLRRQAKLGLTLPEGRTPSEISLISKIKEEAALSKVPPEELQKAKTAGLLTPLKGKSPPEKEAIVRGRAKVGLPLPEGRTLSEKSLIRKVKAELKQAPVSKERVQRAKEKGLLTPLAGKTSAEQEKILHGLMDAGLPLPEGKTSKDRALIKKVKEEHKPEVKEKGSEAKIASTIVTTKCERACGCDKKKIRFKHSYVKIRVTSPDISSLCPCPNECVPGVKGGVFVDNDGIKVIIERAVGITEYRPSTNVVAENLGNNHSTMNHIYNLDMPQDDIHDRYSKAKLRTRRRYYSFDVSQSHIPLSARASESCHETIKCAQELEINSASINICSDEILSNLESTHCSEVANLLNDINHYTATTGISRDSFDSITVIKTETSLSFTSSYDEGSSSIDICFADSDLLSESNTSQTSFSEEHFNDRLFQNIELMTSNNESNEQINAVDKSSSRFLIETRASTYRKEIKRNEMPDDVFQVVQMSSSEPNLVKEPPSNNSNNNIGEPVIIITNLKSTVDLTSVVDEIVTKKEFSEASSLFVVVPTSDEECECAASLDSPYGKFSDNSHTCKSSQDDEDCTACGRTSSKSQDLKNTKKEKLITIKNLHTTTILSSISKRNAMYNYNIDHGQVRPPRNKIGPTKPHMAVFHEHQGVSTDTTQDRPCCCDRPSRSDNVISEVISPVHGNRVIQSPALSVNHIAENHRHPGYQPQQIKKCPLKTSPPHDLKYFKKLLQRNLSTHTLNKILQEIDASQLDRSSLDDSNGSPSGNSLDEPKGNSSKTRLKDDSMAKNDITQKKKCLPTSTVSWCEIKTCEKRSSCHNPEQILQYPFGTPLSEPLQKFKKLLLLNCNPQIVKDLFEKIETGSIKDNELEEYIKTLSPPSSKPAVTPALEPFCEFTSCQGRPYCHPLEQLYEYPFGTPLSPNLVKLKELLEQNCTRKKAKLLFEQIESGKLKDIDLKDTLNIPIDNLSNTKPELKTAVTPNTKTKGQASSGTERPGCRSLSDITQYPPRNLLQKDIEALKKKLYNQIITGNLKNLETTSSPPIKTPKEVSATPIPIMKCELRSEQVQLSKELKFLKKVIEHHECPESIKNLCKQIVTDCSKKNNEAASLDTKSSPEVLAPKTIMNVSPTSSSDHSSQSSDSHSSQKRITLKNLIEQNKHPNRIKLFLSETEAGIRSNIKSHKLVKDTNMQSEEYPFFTQTSSVYGFKPHQADSDLQHGTSYLPEESTNPDLNFNNKVSASTSTCVLTTRAATPFPNEVLRYPYGIPLPSHLKTLQEVLEQYSNPKKVQELLKYIEAIKGRSLNEKNYEIPCFLPSCKKSAGCHLPDEVLQYPHGTLSETLEKLKKIIEHNANPEKVKIFYQQLIDGADIKTLNWDELVKGTALEQKRCKNPKCPNPKCPNPRCDHLPETTNQIPPVSQTPPDNETCIDTLTKSLDKLIKIMERKERASQRYALEDDNGFDDCDFEEPYGNYSENYQAHGYPDSYSAHRRAPKKSRNLRPSWIRNKIKKTQTYQPPCTMPSTSQNEDQNLEYDYNPDLATGSPDYYQNEYEYDETYNSYGQDEYYYPESYSTPQDQPCPNKEPPCVNPRCKNKSQPCPRQAYATNAQPYPPTSYDNKTLPCPPPTCPPPPCSPPPCSPPPCTPPPRPTPEKQCVNPYCKNKSRSCRNSSCKKKKKNESRNKTKDSEKGYGCHTPNELLNYPYQSGLSPQLENLKSVIQQNADPRKVNKIYKQIMDKDLCNIDWTGATRDDPCPPNYQFPKPYQPSCRPPTCKSHTSCLVADELIQNPYNVPLPQQLVKLKTFLEQHSNPNEVRSLFREIENCSVHNRTSSASITPTVSCCEIPTCIRGSTCHSPLDVFQYPFGMDLPEELVKLKKILEKNHDPVKVRELFRKLETENAGNPKEKTYDSRKAKELLKMLGAGNTETVKINQNIMATTSKCPPVNNECLLQLKKLIENKCGPEFLQECIKQTEGENSKRNRKNIGCGETGTTVLDAKSIPIAMKDQSMELKPGSLPPGSAPIIFPPGAAPTNATQTIVLPTPTIPIVLPPEVYAPAPKDEDCAACHKPKYRDGVKMKCACKKKSVKKKPCPCEMHKVSISKDEPGLKIATHSHGAECCICDEYFAGTKKTGKDVIFKLGQAAPSIIGRPDGPVSMGVQSGTGCIICPTGLPCSSEHTSCPKLTNITIGPIPLGFFGQPDPNSQMAELEIIGPQGGYVVIGPDGISTQSGVKVIKFSTGAGTDGEVDNVGAESTSKTKKNCLCKKKRGKKKRKIDCECPSETETDEPVLLYTYEDFEEARRLSKQYKSDLTQTTSGFKLNKKKRPDPGPAPEYTVEDAIRDYAKLKPDFIRSLCPPGVRRNKVDCACEEDKGVGGYHILRKNKKGEFEYVNPPEPEPKPVEVPLKGLKFTIGGKGSGSKGLSGICCFEMYQ